MEIESDWMHRIPKLGIKWGIRHWLEDKDVKSAGDASRMQHPFTSLVYTVHSTVQLFVTNK